MPTTLKGTVLQFQPMLQDRIVGTLFGSALGDAIGLYTEFLPATQCWTSYPTGKFSLVSPVTTFARDSHRSPHHEGDWTDDTDQALSILLSYLHHDGQLLPADFAYRLKIWCDQGLRALDGLPLGLGFTVGSIVRNKEFLTDAEAVATKYWTTRQFRPAPNGSLMRTHPLGLFCIEKQVEQTFDIAAQYSLVTHVDPRCIVSCAIGTALVRGLVRREITQEKDVDDLMESAVRWFEQWKLKREEDDPSKKEWPGLDRAELDRHTKAEKLEELELDDSQKMGYTYKTLGCGILLLRRALRDAKSSGGRLSAQLAVFEKLITELIMFGGDADTNACFAGALLGALVGYKALPPHWRDGLGHKDWLLEKSESLCQVLGVIEGKYVGAKDMDTAPDGGRGFLSAEQMDGRWKAHVQRIVEDKEKWDAMQKKQQKSGKGGTWKSSFGL